MNTWFWLALGAVISGPIWVLGTAWVARRVWHSARKLSARTKGYDHLVELGQLAGGLAHEIKNPLSTINLNLKLLTEDLRRTSGPGASPVGDDAGRILRRLQSVQDEANRLKSILDDFLRYAGKYELTLTDVDLRSLLAEVGDFFEPQASVARVVLRKSVPERPVLCRLDANLIKQALLNLMINAVQAMPEGGELLLKVSAARDEGVIEVIDTGSGIAAGDLPRIFDVYYSKKAHGTGLGLATTRRIIREHAGTIHVESEPGKGTRFIIRLPLANDSNR